MSELLDIIISAVDQASDVFESITNVAGEMEEQLIETSSTTDDFEAMEGTLEQLQSEFEQATSEVERLQEELSQVEMGNIDGDVEALEAELAAAEAEAERLSEAISNIDGSEMEEVASSADDAEQEILETDESVNQLNNDLSIIDSSMLMQLGEQVGQIGDKAEGMAQEMNQAAISVGQLATQTGIAEPEMVNLINTISNATFPNDEAMMYVKSLDQMGISADKLGESATGLDRINDAFGLGAEKTNSLGQELGVLGVDMNNVSSSFNALAYANANTVGGMENYYTFLRKYDAQFNELGYDVDQTSIIIAAATQKYGGGRAALSGLSEALKEADGDTRKLEEALGIQAGTLDNASSVTGEYEGQLMDLASEEAEHKTILDQLGAAWEDVSLSIGSAAAPLLSIAGLIGSVGSFGLQVSGLQKLATLIPKVTTAIRTFSVTQAISNAIEGEGAIARVASAIGITTEAAAAEGATVAFGGLAIAEGAALWPILAIVAAIALFVAAAYEVGKAFGWWSDVGTMLDAIKDGVTRVWNAFINHPDVQAAIQALTDAWNWFVPAVTEAVQAIMDFFGINQSGSFDAVRAIIDGLGSAWDALKWRVMLVVDAFMFVRDGIVTVVTEIYDTVKPIVDGVRDVFVTAWTTISSFLMPIINTISGTVNGLMNVFNGFRQGQIDLPTAIITALTLLWNGYFTILTQVGQFVLRIAGQLIQYGIRMGSQFVNRVLSYIRQLPSRVYSALLQAVSRISSAGQQWITTAKNKAQGIIDGVYNKLTSLPGKISSALSGVVDAFSKPFQDAYNQVKEKVDQIKEMVKDIPVIGDAFGGEEADGRTSLVLGAVDRNSSTPVKVESEPLSVDINQNITLDLANVPAHIDTNTLIGMLSDKKVLTALTGNNDFQSLDAKVKERLNLKVNRARGV